MNTRSSAIVFTIAVVSFACGLLTYNVVLSNMARENPIINLLKTCPDRDNGGAAVLIRALVDLIASGRAPPDIESNVCEWSISAIAGRPFDDRASHGYILLAALGTHEDRALGALLTEVAGVQHLNALDAIQMTGAEDARIRRVLEKLRPTLSEEAAMIIEQRLALQSSDVGDK